MSIRSIDAARARTIEDRDETYAPTTPNPERRPTRSLPEPSKLRQSKHDADLIAFVSNKAKEKAAPAPAPAPARAPGSAPPPPNDRILYVGINDESTAGEAATLHGGGASVTTVLRKDGSTVELDAKSFDLAMEKGCAEFAWALGKKFGLSVEAMEEIRLTIVEASPSMRDELARIAIAIAPGERGEPIPSRLVFSGHSTGDDLHRKGESLGFHSILALVRAMPTAAKQVEDIHFSGCFSGAQVYEVGEWQKACPNLKTMWGYEKIVQPHMPAPHLSAWQTRTRGRSETDPSHATNGVVSWSARDGLKTGVTLESLRADQKVADARFETILSGEIEAKSSTIGPAKDDYETYRQLSHRPELSPAEKKIMEAKAEVLYRVRFYHSAVRKEFSNAHANEINRAYESVGLRSPDFATMTRTEALAKIRELEIKAANTKPLPKAAADALPLLRSFARLEPSVVSRNWCH